MSSLKSFLARSFRSNLFNSTNRNCKNKININNSIINNSHVNNNNNNNNNNNSRFIHNFAIQNSNNNNSNSNNSNLNSRSFMSSSIRQHGGHGDDLDPHAPEVTLTFIDKNGDARDIKGKVGMSILRAAQKYGIELEGACEGVCACSTCHVVFESEDLFDSLEEPSEEEDDMLDQAFGLTPTSRLGCQIEITEELDGCVIRLPAATRNFYVDGHVPVPH